MRAVFTIITVGSNQRTFANSKHYVYVSYNSNDVWFSWMLGLIGWSRHISRIAQITTVLTVYQSTWIGSSSVIHYYLTITHFENFNHSVKTVSELQIHAS